MHALKGLILCAQPVALASSSGGEGEGGLLEAAALTVKYLSSPKLMRLQLQDATLRRHFLLQALIFLHACQNPVLKPGAAAAQQAKKEALRSKQVTAWSLDDNLSPYILSDDEDSDDADNCHVSWV